MGTRAFETLPHATALVVDSDAELAYWRVAYRSLPHCASARWEDVKPALKLGIDACLKAHGRDLTEMLEELELRYRRTNGGSRLEWHKARDVVAAAWIRVWDQNRNRRADHRRPGMPALGIRNGMLTQ